ncbi:hypothetical protein DY000_02053705 [Brassica cretica]|uniref:Uncharacterized protein n=1 Tax=Brassica cretica TaxID=69181 RepID=A0ABQ7AAF6_BRACR|nr:hypothetical protein DY000_02053705 [Brassica cretica]
MLNKRRTKRRYDRPSSSNARPLVIDRDPWPMEKESEPIETWENYADPNMLQLARLEFHLDPLLLCNLAIIPRRLPTPSPTRAAAQPQPEFPDFPHIPDIPMRDHGDFQRVVVDALHAIWVRVSQCRCVTSGSVRARSPSAAGPSRQRHDDSDDDTDED